MKISDTFGGDLLKAADLKGQAHVVVIASVEEVEFTDGKKYKLTFQHRKKAFICNLTNARRIAFAVKSDETDDWIGREIELYEDLVDFQGKTTPAIRVRPVARQAPAPAPRPAAPAPQGNVVTQQHSGVETSTTDRHPNAPGNDFHSDDIPF